MTQLKSNPPTRKTAGKAAGKVAPITKPTSTEEAIEQARHGRAAVEPAMAVEMAGRLYSEGKFAQAERVCRQIINQRPGDADAHNVRGVALKALGHGEEAIKSLTRAVELAPKAANVHSNLGEVLRQEGQLDRASDVLERAVELDPHNAQALNNLGITYFERGKPKVAASYYRRALKVAPTMAEAHNNLGNALRLLRDFDGAIEAYQDALVHRERYPDAYNNLGLMLKQRKDLEGARRAFRRAIAHNLKYPEAHYNLAATYVAEGNEPEALRVLSDLLKYAPTYVPALILTARVQYRRGSFPLAEQAIRHALKQTSDNAEVYTVLGQILHERDEYAPALEALERALEIAPENPEALSVYGIALKSVGRLDEAREYLLKGLRKNPKMFGGYANLNDLINFSEGEGEQLFANMDEFFKAASNTETSPFTTLHFAYAKALDDRGEPERALQHYIIGGRLKRAQLTYDEQESNRFFDDIREAFPKEIFSSKKFAGIDDSRPTFIIGMPRSGSTLVEQILASHPDVYGAGEIKTLSLAIGRLRERFPSLPKFPAMLEKLSSAQLDIAAKTYLDAVVAPAGDAKRITDKLLTNYFFVGLIHLMFPKAKISHTLRDPIDSCLSTFTKLFKDDMPHSYDLGELGRYYAKYRELMAHWDEVLPEGVMTTVRYEDVVADTEKEARRLIEFLGLPWDAKCVDFHKSDRPVKTASVAQVRKPIYKTSVERWKKYGDGLQPLIDAIGTLPGAKTAKSGTQSAAAEAV